MDVELHRHSLGEEYLFSQSSESDLSDVPTSLSLPLSIPAPVKASSPIKQLRDSSPDASVDKGKANGCRSNASSWNFGSAGYLLLIALMPSRLLVLPACC